MVLSTWRITWPSRATQAAGRSRRASQSAGDAKYTARWTATLRLDDVRLEQVEQRAHLVVREAFRLQQAAGALGQKNNPEWKTVAIDSLTEKLVLPNGSIGSRWGEKGKWNLEEKDGTGPTPLLRSMRLKEIGKDSSRSELATADCVIPSLCANSCWVMS